MATATSPPGVIHRKLGCLTLGQARIKQGEHEAHEDQENGPFGDIPHSDDAMADPQCLTCRVVILPVRTTCKALTTSKTMVTTVTPTG